MIASRLLTPLLLRSPKRIHGLHKITRTAFWPLLTEKTAFIILFILFFITTSYYDTGE